MGVSGYTVVLADVSHLSALPGVERAAATRFGTSLPERALEAITPSWALHAAQQDGRLWVALAPDGEPVGFALASSVNGQAHLAEIDVVPEHGQRGVGSALLGAVERWAVSSGFRAITLTTFSDVAWNAGWYSKLGFEPISESDLSDELRRHLDQEEALGLDRSRRIAMRKQLPAAQQAHGAS